MRHLMPQSTVSRQFVFVRTYDAYPIFQNPPVLALIAVGQARRFHMHLVAAKATQLSLLCIVRRKGILRVYFAGALSKV